MERVLSIESSASNLRKVEIFLEEIYSETGIGKEAFGKVLVSVMEAVNNSIIHGNKGMFSKKVDIMVVHQPGKIVVTVKDEGSGFKPDSIPDPTSPENIENLRGRGVFLMRRLADAIEFNELGNSVTMTFNRISD
jgi:serine/threonine-protein kinase RsbW